MSRTSQSATAKVLVETREGAIVTLAMNRPEKMNALNHELSVALNKAFKRLAADLTVNVVVLTGAGRAFCAGGDLRAIGAGREKGDVTEVGPILRSGMQAVLTMRMMPQPVIAAVNGAAAGAGMNLALAADIRVAADCATFGQNFTKVGLFPDYGGTFFLPRVAGASVAAEMFYTGEMIDAKTALQLGIVNHVVTADTLEGEVRKLADKIATGPQVAIRAVKRSLFARDEKEMIDTLENEVEEQLKCFHSEDCAEGIRAFLAKRQPNFQGR